MDMADGGFFGPRVSMERVHVDMSDDWRGGAGTGRPWAVALGGAISDCICCGSMGFGGGGRTNIRGFGYKGLMGWGPDDIAITFENLFGSDFRGVIE